MMKVQNFSKEFLEKLGQHLRNTKPQACDCSAPSVSIFEEVYNLPIKSDTLPSPSIDLVVTRCNNCGKIELIDPRIVSH